MDLFDEHTKQIPFVKKYVLCRKDPVDKAGEMIQRAGGVIDVDNRVLVHAIRKGKRGRNDGWVAWEKKFWQKQAGFLTKPPDSDADSDEDEVDVEEEDNEDEDEHEDDKVEVHKVDEEVHEAVKQAAPTCSPAAAFGATSTSPELQ